MYLNKLVKNWETHSCWRDEPPITKVSKRQCNGALSVIRSCHWGMPRSTSGVRLTTIHNKTPLSQQHKPLALHFSLSTSMLSVIYLFLQCDFFFLLRNIQKANTETYKWLHKASPGQNKGSGLGSCLFYCHYWLFVAPQIHSHTYSSLHSQWVSEWMDGITYAWWIVSWCIFIFYGVTMFTLYFRIWANYHWVRLDSYYKYLASQRLICSSIFWILRTDLIIIT